MDEAVLQEVFEELFQSLETGETQSAAILQFLKAEGIANDENLAPYFEQASKASSVRWVATRARINRLLSAVTKPTEKSADHKSPETSEQQPAHSESDPVQSADSERPSGNSKETAQGTSAKDQSANDPETLEKDSSPSAETKVPPEENKSQTQGKLTTQPEAA
jgi:hypothetical protein